MQFKIALALCALFFTFSSAEDLFRWSNPYLPPRTTPPAFPLAIHAATAPAGELLKPQFYVRTQGGIKDGDNWRVHGLDAGATWKVWESQNQRHSVGLGANFRATPYGRSGGVSIPYGRDYSVAGVYSYKYGKK